MAVGTTTAALLFGGASAGFGLSKLMSKGAENVSSSPQPLPQPPNAAEAMSKAEDVVRKKRAVNTQSIYTSPLGISGQAQIARKSLLGQ